MGVKGLFQFLKRFEKDVSISEYVGNQSVGIDIFWFLYLSRGDMFKLQAYLSHVIKSAKEVHCVFDGKPSREKVEMLQEQAKKRKEIEHTIKEIEQFLQYPFHKITTKDRNQLKSYVNQLKYQIWTPSPDYINYVKQWLYSKGCVIYQVPEEADDLLIKLEQEKVIDIIITNDSDLLILGGHNILRMKSPTIGKLFKKDILQTSLNFTDKQWNDFMLLCRNMDNKDVILAYSLISVYKDLEYSLQKHFSNNHCDLISNSTIGFLCPDIE
jgi:5'-3' exonuclease